MAYNDGEFDEKDWTGIRMLQDSIKVKDPMKVGRFGLGFKSVFHMTGKNMPDSNRFYMRQPTCIVYEHGRTNAFNVPITDC